MLISVYNKQGLVNLAQYVTQREPSMQLLSSKGTGALLANASIPVTPIEEYTGSPEVLDGRVKTLHPAIYGGILNVRDNPTHQQEIQSLKWNTIDVVVVNLYPFMEQHSIENIDIGGVTLLRAAAKNYAHVLVVVDPHDYIHVMQHYEQLTGNSESSVQARLQYARKAFHYVTQYDIAISRYMDQCSTTQSPSPPIKENPSVLIPSPDYTYCVYRKHISLKYGCNPHQTQACTYQMEGQPVPFDVLNGHPGYINVLDANASWALVSEASRALQNVCAASFKHCTPAGVSTAQPLSDTLRMVYGASLKEVSEWSPAAIAYVRARYTDPLSSFGDFVAISTEVDITLARILQREVSDGIIAPAYTKEALSILQKKKGGQYIVSVSYTHLTLPTICSV